MKTEFEKQLNQLLGVRKERTLLMTDERYNELVAETKEANERRSRGLELSGIHYRRLKRFDVMTVGDREKLVQKSDKSQGSEKIYFCMASEMFDVVHNTHLKIGHKKEKGMELELKRKYCNITREVIGIYLSLCQDCALKKKFKAKSLSVKSKVVSNPTSSCQIEIINMEAEPDGVYKFILNYQDCQSKFLILRPLKTKTPEEVAVVLFDIFCLIGVPKALLSDIEHEYCNKILHILSENWHVELERAEPVQDSVTQDVRKNLEELMADNQTRTWASSLRIVQSLRNRSFHPLIQRTPHDAMFGHSPKNELSPSSNGGTLDIRAENKIKEQLTFLKKKLDEVNAITQNMIQDLEDAPQTDQTDDTEDAEMKCLACGKVLLPEVFCWKCNGPLHFNCALTNDDSENPFCEQCASKTAFQIHRRGRKRRIAESPAFTVGDKVMVSMPEMENDDLTNRRTSVGTKSAILERLFYRNESHGSRSASPSAELQVRSRVTNRFRRSNKTSKKVPKRFTKNAKCNL